MGIFGPSHGKFKRKDSKDTMIGNLITFVDERWSCSCFYYCLVLFETGKGILSGLPEACLSALFLPKRQKFRFACGGVSNDVPDLQKSPRSKFPAFYQGSSGQIHLSFRHTDSNLSGQIPCLSAMVRTLNCLLGFMTSLAGLQRPAPARQSTAAIW